MPGSRAALLTVAVQWEQRDVADRPRRQLRAAGVPGGIGITAAGAVGTGRAGRCRRHMRSGVPSRTASAYAPPWGWAMAIGERTGGNERALRDRGAVRDDRVLPETRWLAACIVPFLLVAFAMLYLFPDRTDTLFAWTIRPRMTPLIMGAGYIAGGYFFVQALFARRWHTVHLGFLPVTAFTICMAIGTFLHLDRFHRGHVSFYTWLA